MVERSSNTAPTSVVKSTVSRTHEAAHAPAAVDGDDLLAIALPSLFQSQTTNNIRHASSYSNPGAHTAANIQQSLPASSGVERKHQTPSLAVKQTERKVNFPSTTQQHAATTVNDSVADEDFIRGKLARRAYHLPGNTYCQDYLQYMMNCHLIFGLCCHDKRSPVKTKHRLLLLLGSLALGLIITNVLYLWGNEIFHDDEITSKFRNWATTKIPTFNETTDAIEDASSRLKIATWSKLTLLWSAGSSIHAMSDMMLWHTMSCGYCSYSPSGAATRRESQICGWATAIVIVMLLVIVNCVVAYFRVFPLTDDDEDGDEMRIDEQMLATLVGDDEGEPAVDLMDLLMEGDFSFIYAFHIEFAVAQLVFAPIFMTTLFTGILGCGRMPCTGGRPREVWKERNGKDGRVYDDNV